MCLGESNTSLLKTAKAALTDGTQYSLRKKVAASPLMTFSYALAGVDWCALACKCLSLSVHKLTNLVSVHNCHELVCARLGPDVEERAFDSRNPLNK